MWDVDHNDIPEVMHFPINFLSKNAILHNINNNTLKSFLVQGSLLLNDLKDLDIYNNSQFKNVFLRKLKLRFLENY